MADPWLKSANKDAQQFIRKPRTGWLLTPQRETGPLGFSQTKMGGDPYPGRLKTWPLCSACDAPLNFVLQIHKRRFPQMWFPRNKNLFQIFRCPNLSCGKNEIENDWDSSDRTMMAVYCQTARGRVTPLKYPKTNLIKRFEFPELSLKQSTFVAEKIDDYPSFGEGRSSWWGKSWDIFCDKYTAAIETLDDLDNDEWFYSAEFWDLMQNREGIKIAGLPSWQQGGYPPKCSCGQIKEFIFQLASFRNRIGEICVGDAGNIYYFACRKCGEKSLQTKWDCG